MICSWYNLNLSGYRKRFEEKSPICCEYSYDPNAGNIQNLIWNLNGKGVINKLQGWKYEQSFWTKWTSTKPGLMEEHGFVDV